MTYNPHNLYECEKEKKRKQRGLVDTVMTGIGLIASVSSIPQIIRLYETKTAVGISLATQLIALGAVITWFFYGTYIKSKPLMVTSFFTTIVLAIVVIQIFTYR